MFLALVLVIYWALPHRWRWSWLLLSSYVFYASWRLEYLCLLAGITILNYGAGRILERVRTSAARRACLWASVAGNLSTLFAFKYLGFAVETAQTILMRLGFGIELPIPDILLPVGISFFTFQAMGYTIDVYRQVGSAERHLGYFALYVSFFPQLVAGPIERSNRLLPQLRSPVRFSCERALRGLKLMGWGFFKKLVIADRVAVAVNRIYGNPEAYEGLPLLLGTYLFAIQIYCDFSAYSDIARGSASMLGIELMENFQRPYFATSVREFWSRWHVSLSTWFRDYLYIPLGGNRKGTARLLVNIVVVFLLSGLWHGAGLTFVVWGALHACYYVAEILFSRIGRKFGAGLKMFAVSRVTRAARGFITFHLVVFAWIFFRAQNLSDAWHVVTHILRNLRFSLHLEIGLGMYEFGVAVAAIAVLAMAELVTSEGSPISSIQRRHVAIRWSVYLCLALATMFLGAFGYEEFIYFQF